MLFDSKQVFEDQLEHVTAASERRSGAGALDLALLTDGLKAEREQGITIDVAYRYFATPARRFIIADCPGHQQYTRNMVTGASTADLAVVLVDARRGVTEQSKRHAFISALLGIPRMVVAINKMDLVEHSQERFEELVAEFKEFANGLDAISGRHSGEDGSGVSARGPQISYIPISALNGDNVVERSRRCRGIRDRRCSSCSSRSRSPTTTRSTGPARFPVQWVIRPAPASYGAQASNGTPARRRRRSATPTTAAMPDNLRAAHCGAATKWRCCPAAGARESPRSTRTTASSRRRWRQCR